MPARLHTAPSCEDLQVHNPYTIPHNLRSCCSKTPLLLLLLLLTWGSQKATQLSNPPGALGPSINS
eukprot:1147674-Pelagomonas_calceolata.AAC.3